jgi:hypothetical protein
MESRCRDAGEALPDPFVDGFGESESGTVGDDLCCDGFLSGIPRLDSNGVKILPRDCNHESVPATWWFRVQLAGRDARSQKPLERSGVCAT